MYKIIKTKAYKDQKPGTSGLRKKVRVFMQPNYLENFVQSIFNSLEPGEDFSLVLGGDGRYYNDIAIQKILKMAAANGCKKIIVGQNGLFSTPAISNLIRINKASGGIILSASHNPGGLEYDFGIKYNTENGSAAPSTLTEKIFINSQNIDEYKIAELPDINLSQLGIKLLGSMEVHIIDSVYDYAQLMEQIFDFDLIRSLIQQGIKFKFNAMNAVTGPYAIEIFSKRLGVPEHYIENAKPKTDFGNIHPDPLPENLKSFFSNFIGENANFDIGGACDGDGDRNLIIGYGQFVTPADSLAILLEHSNLVSYYKDRIYGVARSLPTGRAVDAVAAKLNIKLYETPTGWKYFGNLLDAQKITLCGEESFGTSSFHIREKDGIWAILFWLNIMAKTKKSVKQLLVEHWQNYGRCYACRYDFENLKEQRAQDLIMNLKNSLPNLLEHAKIKIATEFEYYDPIDNSCSNAQGIKIVLSNDARIIYRLSGTGTVGATLRIYIDIIDNNITRNAKEILQPFLIMARKLVDLEEMLPTRVV